MAIALAASGCATGDEIGHDPGLPSDEPTGSTPSGGGSEGGNAAGGGVPGGTTSGTAGTGPGTSSSSGAAAGSGGGGSASTAAVEVQLAPAEGIGGPERVSFAVPLPAGLLADAAKVRITHEGTELAAARRALASWLDGSVRSVHLQLDLDITAATSVTVEVGVEPSTEEIAFVPVESTLVVPDGTEGPRVWALLPAPWLAASGFAGPLDTEAEHDGTALGAWQSVCDYDLYDVDAFLASKDNGSVWLFDRGTVLYRGYARRGDLGTLSSAYRETAIYRAELSGEGSSLTIGVPGKASDLKYYYTQNMALHYLVTGDDRFRESAERVAERMSEMWTPVYSPSLVLDGTERWTERHAGFYLLGQIWAEAISDDLQATFATRADEAVQAYAFMQASFPTDYDDPSARCFAHNAADHAEPFGYVGCSPWMSAILADALDGYTRQREGAAKEAARDALVKLGRMVAKEGRNVDGKPFYWMGVAAASDEIDPDNEHWGESAYIVALAWHHDGKQDAELAQVAGDLVAGFDQLGEAPHMRSFNWQCRSAVATPSLLQ